MLRGHGNRRALADRRRDKCQQRGGSGIPRRCVHARHPHAPYYPVSVRSHQERKARLYITPPSAYNPGMLSPDFHAHFMRQALREAARAEAAQEVPTGCVIIRRPSDPTISLAAVSVLARAHNQTEMLCDATAHAEMIALTQASAALGDWRLLDTILYVTKEPCPMCAGAIVLARVPLVVWGVSDPKRGGQSVFSILNHPGLNHRPETLAGVLETECRAALQTFFRSRRAED